MTAKDGRRAVNLTGKQSEVADFSYANKTNGPVDVYAADLPKGVLQLAYVACVHRLFYCSSRYRNIYIYIWSAADAVAGEFLYLSYKNGEERKPLKVGYTDSRQIRCGAMRSNTP